MAKAKGTTINEVAAEIGVSKQRLYSLLSGHAIYEEQVNGLLKVLCADPSELKMIPRDMLIPLEEPVAQTEEEPVAPNDEQPSEAAE
jgi:AcrR family transcriptional regulator